jgi:steroid delta-isomerase-like uncharacterized protein
MEIQKGRLIAMLKHSISVLIIAGILSSSLGCMSGPSQADMNKAIVMQAVDALNKHDYEAVRKFIAEDYVRHCQATPEVTVNSVDELIAFIKQWEDAVPNGVQGVDMLVAEGDLVAFWGTFEGVQEGDLPGIPATGKTISSETAAIHRLKQGKIVETWVTWDNVAILTQLGAFPAPPSEEP